MLRGVVLREREAAGSLEFLDAERAIVAHAGKNHRDRLVAVLFGERAQEMIDRTMLAAQFGSWRELQPALAEDHVLARRDDIDRVRFDRLLVYGRRRFHTGLARDDLGNHRAVRRVQVLHDDVRHAGILIQRSEQFAECFDASGRSADADDLERQTVLGIDVLGRRRIYAGQRGVFCFSLYSGFDLSFRFSFRFSFRTFRRL